MPRTATLLVLPVIAVALLATCGSSNDTTSPEPEPPPPTRASEVPDTSAASPGLTVGTSLAPTAGTVLRFSRDDVHIDVTITQDNATTRDLLSSLPLRVSVEELGGREKISYLPRDLDTAGSRGHDPEDGDLIYYAPWGNVGFYYDAAGIGFDENVIHLGTYDATVEELTALEGADVTIQVVP